MRPLLSEIKKFGNDPKLISDNYKVSMKTATRWLKFYGLLKPEQSFKPGKLDIFKAREIRKLHKHGSSMKSLAEKYQVTFSTISRVVHNIVYHEEKDISIIAVIYNI